VPRVLVVAAHDTTIVQFLLPHIQRLEAMGMEVVLAYQPRMRIASQRIEALGIARHEVAFARTPLSLSNLRALLQLRTVLRSTHFDVVHVHMPVSGWIGRLAARLFSPGSTVIYTVHGFRFYDGGPLLSNALFIFLERIAGRWTHYLEVMNEEDARNARKYRIVPSDRVRCVPGVGVDVDELSPARVSERQVAAIRQELGLGDDDFLVTMVAAFLPRKRHSDALAALARLGEANVHLALAGDGPEMERVGAYSRQLRLANRVHFLGVRMDVPALMRASKAVILPSQLEGLPRCITESLALEVPAIGSDIRGTRELLSEGCGVLVPVGNIDALARAVHWVVTHPREAAEMARLGRSKVEASYSLLRALNMTECLYREVLSWE